MTNTVHMILHSRTTPHTGIVLSKLRIPASSNASHTNTIPGLLTTSLGFKLWLAAKSTPHVS